MNQLIPRINLRLQWKFILLILAITIGMCSLWYTNKLVHELATEEQKKVELWANATQLLSETTQQNIDIEFILKVVENNSTVPVILTDKDDNILSYRNFTTYKAENSKYLERELRKMKLLHPPIKINLGKNNYNYIYYKESIILQSLTLFPYIQLTVIVLFILLSYVAFSAARKSEQNNVWLGLSRETAHQLGTPASSLMAWIEILKDKGIEPSIILELEKDIHRLNIITERFSKIGSQPKLELTNVEIVIENMVDYMSKRMSNQAIVTVSSSINEVKIPLNENLFGWVIENLIKNALDAIVLPGMIDIEITSVDKYVFIDVNDSGKGIPKRLVPQIFRPGFTTKKRGWGLGLSLAKRIIEEYHHGKIFVLRSEIEIGTTFRIVLPRY